MSEVVLLVQEVPQTPHGRDRQEQAKKFAPKNFVPHTFHATPLTYFFFPPRRWSISQGWALHRRPWRYIALGGDVKETSAITFFSDNNGRRYVFWTVAK